MAQTSSTFKPILHRLAAGSAVAIIALGIGAGCAGKSKPMSPQAAAAAQQREQTRQEVASLKQQQNQLHAQASRNKREADQLRSQALILERQGLTNVAAGEAMCDAGDCARGCEIIDRGEARLARVRDMRATADKLMAEADSMMVDAGLLNMEARDLMASLMAD